MDTGHFHQTKEDQVMAELRGAIAVHFRLGQLVTKRLGGNTCNRKGELIQKWNEISKEGIRVLVLEM